MRRLACTREISRREQTSERARGQGNATSTSAKSMGSGSAGHHLAPLHAAVRPGCETKMFGAGIKSSFLPSLHDPIHISRPVQGASDQRHETRGGMRWPLRALDAAAQRRPQAASLPCEPAGRSVEERPPGAMEQTLNTARGTPGDRQSVVTMLVWTYSTIPHGAAGFSEARRSARPWDFQGHGMRSRLRARPRRHKNRAGEALPPSFRGASEASEPGIQSCKRRFRRPGFRAPACGRPRNDERFKTPAAPRSPVLP